MGHVHFGGVCGFFGSVVTAQRPKTVLFSSKPEGFARSGTRVPLHSSQRTLKAWRMERTCFPQARAARINWLSDQQTGLLPQTRKDVVWKSKTLLPRLPSPLKGILRLFTLVLTVNKHLQSQLNRQTCRKVYFQAWLLVWFWAKKCLKGAFKTFPV